jgi:hypothetical protein
MVMKGKARNVTARQLIKLLWGPLVRKRFSIRPPQFYKHDTNRKAHNIDSNTKDNPMFSFDVYYTLWTSFTLQPDSYCYAVTVPLEVVLYVPYSVFSAVSNPTTIVAPLSCHCRLLYVARAVFSATGDPWIPYFNFTELVLHSIIVRCTEIITITLTKPTVRQWLKK